MSNKKKITFTIKHMKDYGRIRKKKKDLLVGKWNKNNFLNVSDETTNNYLNLEKLSRNKYIKSILYQKASCSLLKNVSKSNYAINNTNDFLLSLKNSLFHNPLNVASLYNLVYFYHNKNDIKSCLFYSFILHAILMKILRKYFYTNKIIDKKKNYLKYLLLITYRKQLKDRYKILFIKKIRRKWSIIPFLNDKVLLILLLENLHFLFLNNYKLFIIDKVIYYTRLMLNILKINKIHNYIKGSYFFLNSNLYFIKSSCFLLANLNEKKLINNRDDTEIISLVLYKKNGFSNNSYNDNKNTDNKTFNIMLVDENEIENLLNEKIINKVRKKDNEKIDNADFLIYKDNNKFHMKNILYYEKQFLSFIINEEEITKKIEKMDNLFIHPVVNVKYILVKINECVKFCLSNRLYQFLEQFLMWRARIFFHLRHFEECLSDTCKISLLNIYSEAKLDENDNSYSCFNLRILSLKYMNMLNILDLYLVNILKTDNKKVNKQKIEEIDIKKNKKTKYINEREHQYTWNRSLEDQNTLNFLKYNKKKIPFIF
ncbi:conserved Plasmodium protein, unknown function [Plasmodium relictum]|uniref:Uncharacterized protein n=1 Tax=Plasmodium relictum TaxID=85471 RepID=A0A1J1HED5_PLARL|nr:conserved Plasmodium protein, unknown function [Plasmodium relictum]CRH01774.1 conserved Plasmodium protein, unknown function [Plasmodium relictum]